MWQTKKFKTYAEQRTWIERNSNRYQITVLLICNGYAVEYKEIPYPKGWEFAG